MKSPFPPIEYKEAAPIVFFNGSALEFLQATYRDPTQSFHTRMRAAMAALPFESPKLQATAIIGMGLDFSAKLERAIRRSDRVRLITQRPVELAEPASPSTFKRRI
jgi:hypothetical protein